MPKTRHILATAWLPGVILVWGLLLYALKEGYVDGSIGKALGFALISLVALERLVRLATWLRTEGKRDVREVFGIEKPKVEAELTAWENEAEPRLERLDSSARSRIEILEKAYIKDPGAGTTLALARAYEECGLEDVAKLYYSQLLRDFGSSKEARAVRNVPA